MDKLNDFFKQVGERFSNPLFFSFLLSWMAWNWKVVVVLLFYSPEDVKADGFKSFNDMIYHTVTRTTGIGYPLISAVLYTAIIPFISGGVYMLYGKVKAESRKRHLKWIRSSTIPTSQFLELQTESERLIKNLETEIKNKASYKIEKVKLENEKAELITENSQKDKMIAFHDVRQLNGMWTMRYVADNIDFERRIGISDGNVTLQERYNKNDPYYSFVIENFMRSGNKVFFEVKFFEEERDGSFHQKAGDFQILTLSDDGKILRGVNKDGVLFRYSRE